VRFSDGVTNTRTGHPNASSAFLAPLLGKCASGRCASSNAGEWEKLVNLLCSIETGFLGSANGDGGKSQRQMGTAAKQGLQMGTTAEPQLQMGTAAKQEPQMVTAGNHNGKWDAERERKGGG
jgi:hypothetical protein